MECRLAEFGGVQAWHRPGTSDENVLREVLVHGSYRRRGFDVEAGERWLDLGANVGAFALYCQSRGAEAECYEPEPECFSILERNAPTGWPLYQRAVTDWPGPTVNFHVAVRQGKHHRGTIHKTGSSRAAGEVPNMYGGLLVGRKFDGVKMDIEGSEFGLIDNWLLPNTTKLVMEYHTSRDADMGNLARRLKILKDHFEHVIYPPEYDRKIAEGGMNKTFFDRCIFCWGHD